MNNDLVSENTIIDAIIKRKMNQLQENRIALEVSASELPLMKIKEDDLSVLISCLLDNAIEECIRTPEKNVKLCLLIIKNHLYIEVINNSRKRRRISRRFGSIDSVKECINVWCISQIIEKYDGYINHYIKGKSHGTEILLPLTATPRGGAF